MRPVILVLLVAADGWRQRRRSPLRLPLLRSTFTADLFLRRRKRRCGRCASSPPTHRRQWCVERLSLARLLAVLLEPGIQFVSLEEKDSVDLVMRQRFA